MACSILAVNLGTFCIAVAPPKTGIENFDVKKIFNMANFSQPRTVAKASSHGIFSAEHEASRMGSMLLGNN